MILPGVDEGRERNIYEQYFLTQCFGLSQRLDTRLALNVVKKLVTEYQILGSSISRNAKIIDADIECYVDETPMYDIDPSRYFESANINGGGETGVAALQSFVQDWQSKRDLSNPFGILLLGGSLDLYEQIIIFGGSLTIIDEISLTWIGKKFFLLYEEAKLNSEALEKYVKEENFPHDDYSFQILRTNSDLTFWKCQCVEITRDSVDPIEQLSIEKKLKSLAKETHNLQVSFLTSSKKRAELEKDLVVKRKQRFAIDHSIHGNNEAPVYIMDPSTAEIMELSLVAKNALIKTVLGEEASGENILPLLEKHEVSLEVQHKLNGQHITLEDFAMLTEASVECFNLSPKDRRQILALADYTKNRIKECVQEQGKVKFALERQIAKLARSLETTMDSIKETRRKIDLNEDMSYRLSNILHPPFVERKVEPLVLNQSNPLPNNTIDRKWGMIYFDINEETMDNLRRFRSDWTNNFRNKKKSEEGNDSSENESLLDSDGEESSSIRNDRKWKDKSVGGVCIAAFGVLMKHITGNDSFLVGVVTTFRSHGLIVGPLTEIVPVKIDLSKKDLSFSGLFSSVHKIFKHIQRHGKSCPKAYLSRKLDCSLEFPVVFQFISRTEMQEWNRLGVSINDLLSRQDTSESFGNLEVERLWSRNPQDHAALKFIMVEAGDRLECAVRYCKDSFDEGKVMRWVGKFQSTLDGIDCSRRKLSVTSMITR